MVANENPKVVLKNSILEVTSPNNNSVQGKNMKTPPFYVSLIIGEKLVHNYMVDNGATSSVMPKIIVDQLGFVYEPLEKGVV